MKIKRQSIYLAGRYRSKWGVLGKLWHIYKAGIKGIELAHQGYVVFNPIVNWGIFGLFDNDHEFWIAAGLKLLKDHEIIYMMHGWQTSTGACQELREAASRGLRVWYDGSYLNDIWSKEPTFIGGHEALEPCTEPVTVPYKLEPEVKL